MVVLVLVSQGDLVLELFLIQTQVREELEILEDIPQLKEIMVVMDPQEDLQDLVVEVVTEQ